MGGISRNSAEVGRVDDKVAREESVLHGMTIARSFRGDLLEFDQIAVGVFSYPNRVLQFLVGR